MKAILPALCLALLASCNAAPEKTEYKMLVGTYTEGTGSEGVYLYDFNASTLECTLLDTAAAGNPSFIVPSADRTHAYSVSEYGDGRQGVCSFSMDPGSIEALGFRPGTGADPCNIIISGSSILTADYSGGSLSVFPLEEDGGIGELIFKFLPDEADSCVSHIHCAVESPDGKYVFVTDLGRDAVYRATIGGDVPSDFVKAYGFDREMHPGPRHMEFSRDGRFAYLLGETGDCVTTFRYKNGSLIHISTEKVYDADGKGSADIHISPDGRFVYTSQRLVGDGIAVFRRNRISGRLTRASYCPTGIHPRNFTITPDGRLLLCACRDDNRIEIYSIDGKTGELTATGKTVELPAPVCIKLF